MISVRSGLRILVTAGPVDFRRGMDSLAMLVTDTLRRDPFCGDLFVFRSKRSDRVKILAWDGTGLVLYSKRLGDGPLHVASDSGRRDHVDCFAALGSSRRFGLEESGSPRCGPTVASWIKIANLLAIHAVFD